MIINEPVMNYDRYKESLARTPDVNVPRVRLDLQALIRFAREKGIEPSQLTKEDVEPFINPM